MTPKSKYGILFEKIWLPKANMLKNVLKQVFKKAEMTWPRKGVYPCSTKTREVLGNPSLTAKRFPETREISRGRSPREISSAEGIDFPIPPEFLSSSIFLQGVDQKILPCGQGRIDCVKINPSLPMMREWEIHPRRPRDFPRARIQYLASF